MKIQPGIHQNVVLQKVIVNDNGRLVVFLRDKEEQEKEAEDDPFAAGNAAEVIEEDKGGGITFWPFKTPDSKNKDQSTRTEKERGEKANGDVLTLKNQLTQILEQFLIKDEIKWDIYAGTGMTKEGFWEEISAQEVLDVIYRNICEQFIGMITPFLDKNEYAVRFKLTRQSKDKHYVRVPGMYIKENPFIELMTVHEKQSRVKFTTYEKKEGLDNPDVVSRDTADTEEEIPEGENTFGSR
jgi:hypothetical protein